MADQDTAFARLVTLACHDLRTPLASVYGFARTLLRLGGLDERGTRFLGMIAEASEELDHLIDRLGLAARIESGRFEPNARQVDTLEVAQRAAERLEGRAVVTGSGGSVETDVEAATDALAAIARCVLRHGGLEELTLEAEAGAVRLAPVPASVRPIALGEDLRDFGAAVSVRLVRALGGSVDADGETLGVRLPAPRSGGDG